MPKQWKLHEYVVNEKDSSSSLTIQSKFYYNYTNSLKLVEALSTLRWLGVVYILSPNKQTSETPAVKTDSQIEWIKHRA